MSDNERVVRKGHDERRRKEQGVAGAGDEKEERAGRRGNDLVQAAASEEREAKGRERQVSDEMQEGARNGRRETTAERHGRHGTASYWPGIRTIVRQVT